MKAGRATVLALAILSAGWSQGVLALSCSVSAISTSFGVYSPLSPGALDGTGQVTVRCEQLLISILVSYTIQLSSGSSGSYAPRNMNGPGYQLAYNLYNDASHTQVWGDGSLGTGVVSDGYLLGIIFPVVRSYNVYGRIPAGQNVAPGSYTDSIVVTVNY